MQESISKSIELTLSKRNLLLIILAGIRWNYLDFITDINKRLFYFILSVYGADFILNYLTIEYNEEMNENKNNNIVVNPYQPITKSVGSYHYVDTSSSSF